MAAVPTIVFHVLQAAATPHFPRVQNDGSRPQWERWKHSSGPSSMLSMIMEIIIPPSGVIMSFANLMDATKNIAPILKKAHLHIGCRSPCLNWGKPLDHNMFVIEFFKMKFQKKQTLSWTHRLTTDDHKINSQVKSSSFSSLSSFHPFLPFPKWVHSTPGYQWRRLHVPEYTAFFI